MKMKYVFMFVVVALLVAVCQTQAAFLVAEQGGKVELYSSGGSFTKTFASGFYTPIGVAEGGGNVFVSDYSGTYVAKYDQGGTYLGILNNNSIGGNHGPAGIVYEAGRVDVATYNVSYLLSTAPDAGTEDGSPDTPGGYLYYSPFSGSLHGIASAAPNGQSGTVYYTGQNGSGNGILGWWTPGTAAGQIYDFGATASLRGVVAAGNNTLYVAISNLNKVVKMTYSGTAWTATDFITGLNGPVGLAIDGGSLYVSQFGAYNIWAYSLADASAQWGFSTNSSPQYFTITSIPEPATVSILGLGLLGLLRRRKA